MPTGKRRPTQWLCIQITLTGGMRTCRGSAVPWTGLMSDTPLPDDWLVQLLDIVRRALIMVLGALDDYLGRERTVEPKRKS